MNGITQVMQMWLERLPKAKAAASTGPAALRSFVTKRIYDPVARGEEGEVRPWAGITGALLLHAVEQVQWDLLVNALTSEPMKEAA